MAISASVADEIGLEAELTALGARALHVDGRQVRALAAPDQAGAVARLLWSRGAADVVCEWVEVWSAGVQEVTVPVGRGRTRSNVRVRVLLDGDEVVRVEPNADDVRRAAGGKPQHHVAAEAVAAWERLGRGRELDGDEEP
jgi:hypothetical protein